MQIGIDSFAASVADPITNIAIDPSLRLRNLIDEIALADQSAWTCSALENTIAANISILPRQSSLRPRPRARKQFALLVPLPCSARLTPSASFRNSRRSISFRKAEPKSLPDAARSSKPFPCLDFVLRIMTHSLLKNSICS